MEYLGIDMIEAGNEFGPGTSYGKISSHLITIYHFENLHLLHNVGSALIKVGQCEQRLGSIEREFIISANQCFVGPLHKFLDGEMKTISKERNILEIKRYY